MCRESENLTQYSMHQMNLGRKIINSLGTIHLNSPGTTVLVGGLRPQSSSSNRMQATIGVVNAMLKLQLLIGRETNGLLGKGLF